MPRPKATNGQRFLEVWSDLYYDYTYEKFRPSYMMIAMAEKLSEFYTLSELAEAMKYYFESGRTDFFEFLNKIDKIFKAYQDSVADTEALEGLIDSTTEQVRKIMKMKLGED